MPGNVFDHQANTLDRLRRSMQKLGTGAITGTLKVSAPISNNGSTIGLTLAAVPGLTVASGLAVLPLAGGGLQIVAGGVGISTALATTAPLSGGGNISTGLTIALPQASSTANGYLSSTDWTTFNNKVPSTRTITTTAPLTGGGDLSADRTIAIPVASSTTNGYLSSTDWNTFHSGGGTGTVTSVGLSLPGIFTVSGSPVTTSGTLTAVLATQASTLIFAGPASGAAAAPTFRALVPADLSGIAFVSTITNADASIVTGGTAANVTLAVQPDPNGGINTGTAGLRSRLLFVNTADSSLLNNITTATAFSISPTLAANFFNVAGKTIHIVIAGNCNTGVAQQISLSVLLGGTGIQTPNFTVGGAASLRWQVEMFVTCRTPGASGVMHMVLTGIVNTQGTFTGAAVAADGQNAAVDTTGAIGISAKFAATVANNNANIRHFSVEVWN